MLRLKRNSLSGPLIEHIHTFCFPGIHIGFSAAGLLTAVHPDPWAHLGTQRRGDRRFVPAQGWHACRALFPLRSEPADETGALLTCSGLRTDRTTRAAS
jgi:hypothetical protein